MYLSHDRDYSDAYIVVEGSITFPNPNNNAYGKTLTFRNNAPFISCITKINNRLIDNAEDLDIVMPMHNLMDYSKDYTKTHQKVYGTIIEMNQIVVQKAI